VEHATTPEVVTINGRRAVVVDQETGLPPSLQTLVSTMRITRQQHVTIRGYSSDCADDHPLVPWLEGTFRGLDLRLSVCQACGLIEVHDVSYDVLPGLHLGRRGPARRDRYLGRYSGRRRAGRIYL
jgi:hypothetical protein